MRFKILCVEGFWRLHLKRQQSGTAHLLNNRFLKFVRRLVLQAYNVIPGLCCPLAVIDLFIGTPLHDEFDHVRPTIVNDLIKIVCLIETKVENAVY